VAFYSILQRDLLIFSAEDRFPCHPIQCGPRNDLICSADHAALRAGRRRNL